ncbi:hypothetical protein ACIBL3_42265 [Kribbella sp. NPDC050124]|uniref:hypothetical protein n=1 Tax=Kribbella sp. NPDC050124 TaxID=3364114 RepID=UPI0037B213BC
MELACDVFQLDDSVVDDDFPWAATVSVGLDRPVDDFYRTPGAERPRQRRRDEQRRTGTPCDQPMTPRAPRPGHLPREARLAISVKFDVRHGPVITFGIAQERDGQFRFVVSTGTVVPGPVLQIGNTSSWHEDLIVLNNWNRIRIRETPERPTTGG